MSDEEKQELSPNEEKQELSAVEPPQLASSKLDKEVEMVARQIADEGDVEKVKDLTHAFNVLFAKQNALRVMKLNGLLNTVTDEMILRMVTAPESFSHRDLLDYLSIVSTTMDKASKTVELIDETPAINLSQTNVNINVGEQQIGRESREKIEDAIKAIFGSMQRMGAAPEDIIQTLNEEETPKDEEQPTDTQTTNE